MQSDDLEGRRILDNRYELLELIGAGAMGQVYRARHILLGGHVAVKFLAKAQLTDKVRDSFYQEARVCAQLSHKTIHVVRVSDFGTDQQDVLFYVMEFLEGETLRTIIDRSPLDLERFLEITQQICLGLQAAHEGILIGNQQRKIIHRDIKPGNIMVVPSESLGEIVKILDFGISRVLETDSHSTNVFMGTLAYSSPEQLDGFAIDNRSDIYSLGIMMFQMLSGHFPIFPEQHTFGRWYAAHHKQTPFTFAAVDATLTIPSYIESIIQSCLEKDPQNRPQTAQDILTELQSAGYTSHLSARAVSFTTTFEEQHPSSEAERLAKASNIFWSQTWPEHKPVARIVFPKLLSRDQTKLATLWSMFHQEEITCLRYDRASNHIYRNFLYRSKPHPVILWLTAIYNSHCHQDHKPCWLTAYLDLSSPQVSQILAALSEQQRYRVLMFALESPTNCANVITVGIDQRQRHLLEQWLKDSSPQVAGDRPTDQERLQFSKDTLREEFEALKPKVNASLTSDVAP